MAAKAAVSRKDAYHHGDLRAQLIRATQALLEERGPEKFSVADACRLAGVSTAAPYRHFDTKQDMLEAAALDGIRRKYQRMCAAAAQHPPGSMEGLSAFGIAYVEFAIAEPELFRMIFSIAGREDCANPISDTGEMIYAACIDSVTRYMGKSEPDDESSMISLSLWTVVHGLSFLAIDGKLKHPDGSPVDFREVIRSTGGRILRQ